MAQALLLAREAYNKGEVPIGAVLVRDNALIGKGYNQPISSCDPSAHAEIVALKDAGTRCQNYRLPGSTLFVTIEPCTMCFGALVHARVSRVVYGAKEPKAGVLDSNPILDFIDVYNHQLSWVGGCLEQESSELIKDFFQMRRSQKKSERPNNPSD